MKSLREIVQFICKMQINVNKDEDTLWTYLEMQLKYIIH